MTTKDDGRDGAPVDEERIVHDYLWDRSGDPDAEVERLEQLLAPYRHRGAMPRLPPLRAAAPRRLAVHAAMGFLVTAASLLLVAAAAWFSYSVRPKWTVQALAGAPTAAGAPIGGPAQIPNGEIITTDASSRARVDVGSIGIVDIEPNSRVRLMVSRTREHRLALDRGQIRALIWAPPQRFFVNTPSSTAIDLGCAYTLKVDDRGWGRLLVESGWVAFQHRGRESFIPTGAICATRPGAGPGTPHYDDAAPGVEDALTILDFSPTDDVRRQAALDTVLTQARTKDAFTLWHLLSRGTPEERRRVYDRLASLVPPPPGITRDAVLRGDRPSLDAWWNTLGLDSASWWRIWKRKW
jgi:ferric-dicitrate binding protein FerR (iron transport regulator)